MPGGKETEQQGKKVVVRWIDPDIWGFRAWSTLFAIARRVEQVSLEWHSIWLELARRLPDMLPCHTCRCCCAKFIKTTPPESLSPLKWLFRLRTEVMNRNLKSADCNRLDKCMASSTSTSTTLTEYVPTLERFAKREALLQLWLMDVFMFLSCVAMTLDLADPAVSLAWLEFVTLVLALSPINLQLSPPKEGHASVDLALGWITSSHLAPNPALMTILAHVTVKSREMFPKVKKRQGQEN